MITAMWHKLRADIKTHKLQFFLIGGVLALSAMLLTVSLLVMGSADEPWDRTFEETNGPHLWLVSQHWDLDFSKITADERLTETTGVLLALAENPMILEDEKLPLFLYAMDEPPPVAHPLLAEGRWLDPEQPSQVVLDYSLARYYDLQVGEDITVLGAEGPLELQVVGLAVTGHWFPYDEITKDASPGVMYISEATLQDIQPDPAFWYTVMGIRIKEPETSKEFAEFVYEKYPNQMRSVIEWQWVKQNATFANQINVLFMGLFSMLGLVAVGLIIFNTIGGQVLSQYREIGFLKAAGFKPSQVTMLFLAEHLIIGLLAAILGVTAGLLVAPVLISPLAENLNTIPPDLYSPGPIAAVVVLVEIAVALATLIPAWQGGRINTVQAISVGYRQKTSKASRLARLVVWLRLPAIVVLGVKDTFSRPLRAVLAITGLALTILVAIISVGAKNTAEELANNRVYFNGTSADMKIERNFIPPELVQSEILAHPQVMEYYDEIALWGTAPGQSEQPIHYRMLNGSYQNFDFQIKEGRMFAAPDEAVVGYAVLDLLDAQIGDTLDFFVDGEALRLTIVGRHLEGYNMNNVVLTGQDTYHQQVSKDARPTAYYLRLLDSQKADDLRGKWLEQSQGLLTIHVINEVPQASMTQLVNIIVSLGLILTLVAGANLMSTSLLSILERVRDFGIQKTLGLTPYQIAGSVMVGSVTLALIALLVGIPLGIWLMQVFVGQVGIQMGAGPDFYTIHWSGISLLVPLLVLLALVSSLAPALHAARLEVIDALRYE